MRKLSNTSSKTRSNGTVKIVSARKRKLFETFTSPVGLILFCLALLLAFSVKGSVPPRHKLVAGGETYMVRLAATPEARMKGLSGVASLHEDEGMLFVFEAPGMHCFWMKDMGFPLDIMWANQNKRVVHIERNVSPDTYPASFCPDEKAQYVLELNAGEAERAGLRAGQLISF